MTTTPTGSSRELARLLLMLGMAAGGLSVEADRNELIESMRSGRLDPAYLIHLRDQLNEVLVSVESKTNAGGDLGVANAG